MEVIYQEVDFEQYCNTCKYKDTAEEKDPCHICLASPMNLHSCKPVNWKEKD